MENNEQYYLGALDPKVDLRDYSYEPEVAMAANELPEEFELWTPDIKNQGAVGSCVAHTAAEIEEYFNHIEGKDNRKLSVGYIYGCRYGYKDEGMYLRDALKTLANRGICTYDEFPYNKEVPTIIELFNKQDEKGWETDSAHKISTYFRIKANNDETLQKKVKMCLLNNGPVMMSVPWYKDFKVENGIITSPSNMNTTQGGHCIYLYGWDKNGWKIQNSWGSFWGNGGRAIYPYNYPINEFWGITDINLDDIKKKEYNKTLTIIIKIVNAIINLCRQLTFKK